MSRYPTTSVGTNTSTIYLQRQPGLSTSLAAIFTVVHLMLKHLPTLLWSDLTLNMRLPHGTHIPLVTFLNLIKSSDVLHVSPKISTNGPSQFHNLLWNWAGSHLTQRRRNARLTLLYKSIHSSASVPTDHIRQPSRHPTMWN